MSVPGSHERNDRAGLFGKYYGLRRTRDAEFRSARDGTIHAWKQGSLVEGWYFVIREGDEAGWKALEAYADACESYAPELASDLRARVREERLAQGLYDAMWER